VYYNKCIHQSGVLFVVSLSIRCIISRVSINQVYYLYCLYLSCVLFVVSINQVYYFDCPYLSGILFVVSYQSGVLFVVSLSIRYIISNVFINQVYYKQSIHQSGVLCVDSLSIKCIIGIFFINEVYYSVFTSIMDVRQSGILLSVFINQRYQS
jgi:hypothetical protein